MTELETAEVVLEAVEAQVETRRRSDLDQVDGLAEPIGLAHERRQEGCDAPHLIGLDESSPAQFEDLICVIEDEFLEDRVGTVGPDRVLGPTGIETGQLIVGVEEELDGAEQHVGPGETFDPRDELDELVVL